MFIDIPINFPQLWIFIPGFVWYFLTLQGRLLPSAYLCKLQGMLYKGCLLYANPFSPIQLPHIAPKRLLLPSNHELLHLQFCPHRFLSRCELTVSLKGVKKLFSRRYCFSRGYKRKLIEPCIDVYNLI